MRDLPARNARTPRRWFLASLCFLPWPCLALIWPERAAAQAAPAAAEAPREGTNAALLHQGRPLLLEAQRLFAAGDPAASIPLLERAYQLGQWPGCLLNLAMAHHALAHCPQALEYYQRYLSADPYTERRAEVMAALNELTELCGATTAAPLASSPLNSSPPSPILFEQPVLQQPVLQQPVLQQPVAPRPPPVAPREPASRALEWSLVGTGLASGVAALGFALASQRKQLEASRFESFDAGDARARDIHDAGVRYNRLSWGLGIGSLALLGGGTALWLWSPSDASSALEASVAGLQYRGRF